jgi:hypothetical protein
MGNWKHLQIIQKISEQQSGKARNQGTTRNTRIVHCTHTAQSTSVKVLKRSSREITLLPWPPHSRGFWVTHNEVPQSVGLLWTSDQLVADTST